MLLNLTTMLSTETTYKFITTRHSNSRYFNSRSLPEDEPESGHKSGGASVSPKKKSPTRANSMPPRPNRPQVLKRNATEIPMTAVATAVQAAAPVATPIETYSINGINYTTYTTFRSPMTPDDPPPGTQTSLD